MLQFEKSIRDMHEKIILEFNWQLAKLVQGLHTDLDSVGLNQPLKQTKGSNHFEQATIELYDSWAFMTKVLDNHSDYGFDDNSCIGYGCVWWDHFHPTSAFHRLLAADLHGKLEKDI